MINKEKEVLDVEEAMKWISAWRFKTRPGAKAVFYKDGVNIEMYSDTVKNAKEGLIIELQKRGIVKASKKSYNQLKKKDKI